MPSPEQPGQQEGREREPLPYLKAARFAGEQPAGDVYEQLQTTIYTAPACDVSVFRLSLNRSWHVAVLGQAPPEALDQRISRLLARGEAATLPAEVVHALAERRARATRIAPWVERHER